MLEEIYPRLLSEVIPSDYSLSQLDVRRMIEKHREGVYSNQAYGQLVKSIYERYPDSSIGLFLGRYLQPSRLCDFSRVLLTADTAREAVSLLERFYYIQGACYHPFVSVRQGKVRISLIFPYKLDLPEVQKRFCTETAFSYLINGFRESVSPDFEPNFLTFDYAQPDYISDYKETFGERLEFNHALNMIEFDEHYLNLKLCTRNPTLHHMYLNKYLDYARENERLARYEYKAISYLVLHHPETLNSKKLAHKLNISVRGLQKRLSKNGHSFSSIANQCRRELSKVYLIQENQNLDFTAEQLGFQTNSGFRRFFKAEFDATPAEYLEGVRAPRAISASIC